MTAPTRWPMVQIHEISRPKQWNTIKATEMSETGYPVYGANGVIGHYHSYNHTEPTILIGCRGTCGVVNVSVPRSWVTGNAMALDDLDTDRVDLRYLVHALQADGLQAAVTGSSQPQITQASLKRVHIPLPPIPEQRRIAATLDAAEAIRAKRRRAEDKIDEFTRSAFVDLFGDPATSGVIRRAPIGEVARVITGNTPPRSQPENFDGHIEWLKSDNIQKSGIITAAAEGLSEVGRKRGREAPVGASLVVCIAGSPSSIGRTGYLDRAAAFNQQINAVVPGAEILPGFLFHQLKVGKRLIQRVATSSMKGMVSKSTLEAVEILVPPLADQSRFVELTVQADALARKATTATTQVSQLLVSLGQRAFRGEL